MGSANAGNRTWVLKDFWFHGYDYNATPGSRTAVTGNILNGSIFCLDPEAYTDESSLPSGMTIKGNGSAKYALNVCKPTTGVLSLVAGVLVNAPHGGLTSAQYTGGCWVQLAVAGDSVPVLFTNSVSLTYGDGGSYLGATNGQWYASVLALGTNGANLPYMFGRPLLTTTTAASGNPTADCSIDTRMMMRHQD
jgi:hypothetical protein